jgi:O-antigen/teichoic acid export membrane protein
MPMKKFKMDDHERVVRGTQIHQELRLSEWIWMGAGPSLIAVFTSLSTFLALILIYRHLPLVESAVFTLFQAIVPIAVMVAGIGQPTLILREYSRTSGKNYDWVNDLATTLLISLPITILISISVKYIYGISTLHAVIVLVTSFSQLAILIETQILNSRQHYRLANLLLRITNGLLIFPAILIKLLETNSKIDVLLVTHASFSIIVSLLGLIVVRKMAARGKRKISLRARVQGMSFLFTQTSYSLPEQAIVSIAGGILPVAQLAIYGSMSVILKPFDLLASVGRNILTPEFSRNPSLKRPTLIFGLWVVGIFGFTLTILLGPPFFDIAYSGIYSEGLKLIPLLGLAGLFRLVEILPRSYVIGNADNQGLRNFVFTQALIASAVLLVGLSLFIDKGAWAIAFTMLLIQLGRFVVSSLSDHKTRRQVGGQSSRTDSDVEIK